MRTYARIDADMGSKDERIFERSRERKRDVEGSSSMKYSFRFVKVARSSNR